MRTAATACGFVASLCAVLPPAAAQGPAPPVSHVDEAAIVRAVQAVANRMPHQVTGVTSAPPPQPLTHGYHNPHANFSALSTRPPSDADLAVEWVIDLHRGPGGPEFVPASQLEAVFNRISRPCLDVPPYNWGGTGGPMGPASCAGRTGRARGAGTLTPARRWRLKAGYPKMDRNFESVSNNPNNNAGRGVINFEHADGIRSRFTFKAPPDELEEGRDYEISMKAVSVTPPDAIETTLAMMWVDAPTRSNREKELVGAKRPNSSFYVAYPIAPLVASFAKAPNWSQEEALTFTFAPKASATEFKVVFGPQGYGFDYVYEPLPVEPAQATGDYQGHAVAFITTSCANIRVEAFVGFSPRGIISGGVESVPNGVAESAYKVAQEVIANLRTAIEAACQPLDRRVRFQKVTPPGGHPAQSFALSVVPGGPASKGATLALAPDASASAPAVAYLSTASQLVAEGPAPAGWALEGFLVKPDPSGTATCTPAESYAGPSAVIPADAKPYLVCVCNHYDPPGQGRAIRVQAVTGSDAHPAQAFTVSVIPGGPAPVSVTLALPAGAAASWGFSVRASEAGQRVTQAPVPDGWSLVGFVVKADPAGSATCTPHDAYAGSFASVPADNQVYLVCVRNDFTPAGPLPPPTPLRMRQLVTWYHFQTHDSVTCSLEDTVRRVAAAGYASVGDAGGYVFADHVAGTVPLKLFYSDARADYFTTATTAGEQSAVSAGYRLVGIEGYVYPSAQPLAVPLRLFWNDDRLDNLSTASSISEAQALAAGYAPVRIEGFLQPSASVSAGACGLGVRWEESEDGWLGVWTRRGDSGVFDAAWTGPAGQRAAAVVVAEIAGTRVSVRRDQPGFGMCTYTGELAADGASVAGTYTCSWWPVGGTTRWQATIRCR